MHIRGAAIDRIEQDLVDEAHDRRGLGVRTCDVVGFLGVFAIVEVDVLKVFVADIQRRRFDGAEGGVDEIAELVVLDQHRLGSQPRIELDLVQTLQVGRVRGRDVQALATFEQRQGTMLADQRFADITDRRVFHVHRIEIEQRQAELTACGHADIQRGSHVLCDHPMHQRHTLFGRSRLRIARYGFRQQPFIDQSAR